MCATAMGPAVAAKKDDYLRDFVYLQEKKTRK